MSEALDDALHPARQRFLSLILPRVVAFETYRQQAENKEATKESLTAISDLAHKISGVSATLGFPYLGQLAAMVERAVTEGRGCFADPQQHLAAVDPHLEALLVEMEARLDD